MMESTTGSPKYSYPENFPYEITGFGLESPIEIGARKVVVKGVEWFEQNPKANPDISPESKQAMVDFKADEIGAEDFIGLITRVCEEEAINSVICNFCLKHIFLAVRHGWDKYLQLFEDGRKQQQQEQSEAYDSEGTVQHGGYYARPDSVNDSTDSEEVQSEE